MDNINKLYDKQSTSFISFYGGSLILVIIMSFITLCLVSGAIATTHAQEITADWDNQRCKPWILPFSSLLDPAGNSAETNFAYCNQNITKSLAEPTLQPLLANATVATNIIGEMQQSINDARGMFNKVRNGISDITENVMQRTMNVTIPLQSMVISFRDLVAKIHGTLTAALFTVMGSYLTLKSLLGAIADFISKILIALAALIAAMWIMPFTWGAAAANTVIFTAAAVPFALVLAFMSQKLHISTSTFKIPKLKCFAPETELLLDDGITLIQIQDIIPGAILKNNNKVLAWIKLTAENSTMYLLDGIKVSDSHLTYLCSTDNAEKKGINAEKKGSWLRVSEHPNAIICPSDDDEDELDEPFIYCLKTSKEIIEINNTIFSDWDETVANMQNAMPQRVAGYSANTLVKYKYSSVPAYIWQICIGDILENGAVVYGIVILEGGLYNLLTYCNNKIPTVQLGEVDAAD